MPDTDRQLEQQERLRQAKHERWEARRNLGNVTAERDRMRDAFLAAEAEVEVQGRRADRYREALVAWLKAGNVYGGRGIPGSHTNDLLDLTRRALADDEPAPADALDASLEGEYTGRSDR